MSPRRLLLVAYYFPPDGGAGTQRPLSFARHLHAHGWNCTVISRAPPASRGIFNPLDASLTLDLPAGTEVRRTASDGSALDVFVEEARSLAQTLHRERPFDAALVTMSPFQLASLIGPFHALGIPTVIDLRDPWALDGWIDYRTYFHWRAELGRMRRALRAASGVVANVPEAAKAFQAVEPGLDGARLTSVTNGWEESDFTSPPGLASPYQRDPSRIRLVFSGTFVPDPAPIGLLRRAARHLRHGPEPIRPIGRTPTPFLDALSILKARGDRDAARIRLVIAGQLIRGADELIRGHAAAEQVDALGFRPHSESVALVRAADALLLSMHGLPEGRRALMVPGKTYEYLASGRPILGCCPSGDARDFLQERGGAYLADPIDPSAIADALKSLVADLDRGLHDSAIPVERCARFSRRALTGDLARHLDRIVSLGIPRTTRA